MGRIPTEQISFFSPEFADPTCCEEGSLVWLLRKHAKKLFPAWLFREWSGHGQVGRDAWPPSALLPALILREGETRRALARRLKHDTRWRAASGLEIGGRTPSEAAFRRFEKYLRGRHSDTGVPRELLLHEHIVRLCLARGIVGDATCVIDSTPMWCYGAVHGTVRLLGEGLRRLATRWAQLTQRTVEQLADDWAMPVLIAKSVKGAFSIDWKDAVARSVAIDQLAQWALTTVKQVRCNIGKVTANKRKGLLKRCAHLVKILRDDFETDDEGRLVVARRVAKDRLVSIEDPQARSSRKSRTKRFKGYKVHLLGDAVSGLIISLTVTPANVGDGQVAHRLIRRAAELYEDIDQVLGDTAYGGAKLHKTVRTQQGIDILAPPVPVTKRNKRFGVEDMHVDVENMEVTCPADETVELRSTTARSYARWPTAVCQNCSLSDQCLSAKARTKTVHIHRQYAELQRLRKRWKDPKVRQRYRERTKGERLVREQVRRGCRQANAWGLKAAVTQAHLAAIRVNLALLSSAMAEQPVAKAA